MYDYLVYCLKYFHNEDKAMLAISGKPSITKDYECNYGTCPKSMNTLKLLQIINFKIF